MKKNLSNLCLAGLVALAAVVATGCGSDDTVFAPGAPPNNLTEYAIIPNAGVAGGAAGSLVVKGINTFNGTSNVVNNSFASPNSVLPVAVRSHPRLNVFYVLSAGGGGQLTAYSILPNGGIAELNTVACPTTAFPASNAAADGAYLIVHPAGGAVYAGTLGANGLRQFNVGTDGRLTVSANPGVAVGAGWDGDFSFGGGKLHVPNGSNIRSYDVSTTYQLTNPIDTAVEAGATVTDVDVRVGQASLTAAGFNGANGKLFSVPVNNGVLGTVATTTITGSPLGTGDITAEGRYFVGAQNSDSVFGFNVDNATGALTAIGTSVTTGANALFTVVDPLNAFVVSTQGAGSNNIDARSRDQNGVITAVTSDSQGLSNPRSFDFVQFINGGYVNRS